MDISKKELNRIIAEEVQKELQEQGLDEIFGGAWDKIKSAFGTEVGGTPAGPDAAATHTAPTAQANPAQQKQLERIGKAITPRIRKMINIGIRTPSMFQMFLKQIILPNVADVVTDTMRAKVFRNMATSETKPAAPGEKEPAPGAPEAPGKPAAKPQPAGPASTSRGAPAAKPRSTGFEGNIAPDAPTGQKAARPKFTPTPPADSAPTSQMTAREHARAASARGVRDVAAPAGPRTAPRRKPNLADAALAKLKAAQEKRPARRAEKALVGRQQQQENKRNIKKRRITENRKRIRVKKRK